MCDAGGEIRYEGVRKRKWGKYVAEIRSGRRSRISLGSYFTAEAAGRAYDAALLCLRGPQASSFNFPDSAALDLPAAHENNPSPDVIRTTAIAIGSEFDTVPARYHDYNLEAGRSADQTLFAEGVDKKEAADKVEEEEEMGELNDAKYLMQSPKGISFEKRIQMSLLLPEDKETTQSYDPSQAFSDLGTLDETICQAAPAQTPAN